MGSFAFLLLVSLWLVFPSSIYAGQWYFPMDKYFERQTVKGFGTLIDDNFYKGKEELFPYNRFYGYHAGVDLEAFPNEQNKNVPVYAITSGIVTYIGTLSGYGGIILEKLDIENKTALYGHLKVRSLPYKVGEQIKAGQILTYLGDSFSEETSKERKHLHFAIYKGSNLYFRGHENDLNQLNSKWENPNEYLKKKGAILLSQIKTPLAVPTPFSKPLENRSGILYTLFKNLLQIFGIKI